VEPYEQIRREYEFGAGTVRAVARKLGVHRREVRRALANGMPPDRKKPQRERTRLAPAIPFIDAILEADCHAPRKQRHTAHRIWTRLRQEKPEIVVGESTVREYVNLRKQALGLLGHEVLVPQSYQFGGEAQVDWYEIQEVFDGQSRKVISPFDLRAINSLKQPTVKITGQVAHLLVQILAEMSRGNAVKLIPVHAELRTQDVAEQLNVARPTLTRLLDEGKIGFHKVGTHHRRVPLKSALAYKRQIATKRKASLAELAVCDQELDI
jgi:excisionase family DNA binding protein